MALRAKQREGWTSQQTQEQAKQGIKGCQMLKRRRERLGRLNDSNEIYSKGSLAPEILEYVTVAPQIYTKAETVILR